MGEPTTDHAGVRFPPPFVYVGGLLVGVLLDRWWPLEIPAAFPLAGYLAIGLGLLLMLLGFREFRRFETSVRPDHPSSAILQGGPFRFSRNPLYIALAFIHLGVAIWMNNAWSALMLIPVLILIRTQVIAREEAYLERRFGNDYLSYKASVRRWI